jgi:hypothetical protein
MSFVPRLAVAVLAVGVVLPVAWLAVWVSVTTVDGAILPAGRQVVMFGLIAVGSMLGLSLLVARGVLTMRRRPVTLWPMTASVPGFDGSAPDAERYRARLLPLRELARAVELSERHGDVEDNDLFRSRGRALWTVLREPVLLGVALVPYSGLYSAAVMQSIEYGALTAVLSAVVGVVLAARRGQRARGRVSEPDGWRTWERACAWRRPNGQVAAVLFDDAGGAVWSIPVDRVFAADARVEIGDVLERDQFPAVRANGVRLLACGPAELVSPGVAVGMRQDLIWALTGPRAAASAPLT